MFKLLVVSCLLVSCLAEPFSLPSWLRQEGRRHRNPRGCADRAEGWRACAQLNATETLAPHGYDCSLFFYCRSPGARPACRKCPAGLHFNPQLQVCDWPVNVECTPRPPRPSRPPPPVTPEEDTTKDHIIAGGTDFPLTDVTIIDVTVTDAPPSDVPVTDVPVTDAPATDAPPSDVPVTDVPVTDVPVTDVPVTDVPVTDVPVTDVPVTDVPVTDVPVTDVPVTDVPVTDVPTTDVPYYWWYRG